MGDQLRRRMLQAGISLARSAARLGIAASTITPVALRHSLYSEPVSTSPLANSATDPGAVSAPTPHEVLVRLRAYYGPPEPRHSDGPLAELVQTILSQNTSDVNTERAFASLWARFGD